MDWQVFNRLYSEEFSIDLLHAWRQVRVIAFSVEVIVLEIADFLKTLFRNGKIKENPGILFQTIYLFAFFSIEIFF